MKMQSPTNLNLSGNLDLLDEALDVSDDGLCLVFPASLAAEKGFPRLGRFSTPGSAGLGGPIQRRIGHDWDRRWKSSSNELKNKLIPIRMLKTCHVPCFGQ